MLSYAGNKIIPAPVVTVAKHYRRSDDGTKLGTNYSLTLTGTLLPFKGSPSGTYSDLSTAFWQLSDYPPDEDYQAAPEDFNHLLRKQEALRWLFSQDGQSLEWQANGQPVVKCNPNVLDIRFAEGNWTQRCDYTVDLDAQWIYVNSVLSIEDPTASGLINSAGEDWAFEELDGRQGQQFRVTHTVTANGLTGHDVNAGPFGGRQGWENAKLWCDGRALGQIDNSVANALVGQTGWLAGDYLRNTTINKLGGTCAITETWLLGSGSSYVEKTYTADWDQATDEWRIRCEGVVYGLSAGSKAGSTAAMLVSRNLIPSESDMRTESLSLYASLLNGKTLTSSADRKTVALNSRDGTASFSYEWVTSDNIAYTSEWQATLAYDANGGLTTLNTTLALVGKGLTVADRLANAKAASPTDADARIKGLEIISPLLPTGVVISDTLAAKTTAINEKQGTVNMGWTWDSAPEHNLDVSVQTQGRAAVVAIIPIPGRQAGPIIQDMNTTTEKVVSVTIRGKGYKTQPDAAAMRALCDSYLGIDPVGVLVTADNTAWDPIAGTYERALRYLAMEGY